jgi:hypothetical protein
MVSAIGRCGNGRYISLASIVRILSRFPSEYACGGALARFEDGSDGGGGAMAQRDSSGLEAERQRLNEANAGAKDWRRWGPYVSERQWGTVREDYSADGNAWDYFSHEQARSRTYRWGEDGLGGFCDAEQILCLGLALWNGADPILKRA